jgi:hypothetical protein
MGEFGEQCKHGTAIGFTCLNCETERRIEEKKAKDPNFKVPRTFLSPAYLVEVEAKTYGLYRDVLVMDEKTQKKEKLGTSIGPIGLFREKEGDEPVNLQTFHPVTKRVLYLTRISS